mgnify:CR=1 FL=1
MNLLLSVALIIGLFYNEDRLEVYNGVSEPFIRGASIQLFKSSFTFHDNGQFDHFSEYLWGFVHGKWRVENGTLIIKWESGSDWIMIPIIKHESGFFTTDECVVFVDSRHLVKYLSLSSESDERFWLEWKYSKP